MIDAGYSQFCPVAKGAEIVATRWTPLVLRELMCGEMSFNDIHRGVPRMSRAILSERLKQLEADGIVAKVPRAGEADKGRVWILTPARRGAARGDRGSRALGLTHGRQRVTGEDYDSTVLMWALRRRCDREALPAHRVVVRFDLSGVARCRTGLCLRWLVLERHQVDVCLKDRGHPVDAVVTGSIGLLIDVYLGHIGWGEATRSGLVVVGDRQVERHLDKWLRLDRRVGRDLPIVPASVVPP